MSSVKEARLYVILDAACKVFAKSGFEKAKIEDIAKAAGIGKSTIYEYFDSKMSVFITLFESVLDLYKSRLSDILSKDIPFREKLLSYMKLHCDSISDQYQVVLMHLHETMYYKELRDFAYQQYSYIHKMLLSSLEEEVAKGEIRADVDPNCVLYLIFGSVKGISFDYIFGRMPMISEESLGGLVDSIIKLVSPPIK